MIGELLEVCHSSCLRGPFEGLVRIVKSWAFKNRSHSGGFDLRSFVLRRSFRDLPFFKSILGLFYPLKDIKEASGI